MLRNHAPKTLLTLIVFIIFTLVFNNANISKPVMADEPEMSEKDWQRVQFANQILRKLFFAKKPSKSNDKNEPLEKIKILIADLNLKNKNTRLGLTKACLETESCLNGHKNLDKFRKQVFKSLGGIIKKRGTHVVPHSVKRWKKNKTLKNDPTNPAVTVKKKRASADMASEPMYSSQTYKLKSDEYFLHTYVKYNFSSKEFHLRIIFSENEKGELIFQRLEFLFHQKPAKYMPEGAVC